MNIKEVKDLIHEILQSDISEFELEHTGTRIRLKRGSDQDFFQSSHSPRQIHISSGTPVQPRSDIAQTESRSDHATDSEETDFHIITSPIVGTAYRSPSPGSDPFVHLGDHVKENTVLCIVEAMKLMNEIPSDIEGEIVRIYFENGNPVEFGQKLYAIRPIRQG